LQITPELRDLTSSDYPDIEELVVGRDRDFCISFAAEIGPTGQLGSELYYFVAASPSAVRDLVSEGPRFLRHHLFMEEFSFEQVRDSVERLCSRCTAEDWAGVVAKLSRYMGSEYEDYQANPWPRSEVGE